MHNIDSGDCKFDIVYCIVQCCFVLCVTYFLTSFMFDCCTTELMDLQNDMYVCMYNSHMHVHTDAVNLYLLSSIR